MAQAVQQQRPPQVNGAGPGAAPPPQGGGQGQADPAMQAVGPALVAWHQAMQSGGQLNPQAAQAIQAGLPVLVKIVQSMQQLLQRAQQGGGGPPQGQA